MLSGMQKASGPQQSPRGRQWTRRELLKTAAVGSLAATAPHALLRAAKAPEPRRKPNIIYILADDLGYGDLGCYGQKKIKTPGLDRLAARGLRFTSHYSGSTVCAPSRCTLMTGMHTGHARIRDNGDPPLRPSPADRTVAEHLKQAGYTTACIGKWGLGDASTTGGALKKGFDHFFGYYGQVHAHHYYPSHLWRNNEKVPLAGNAGGKKQQYSHDLLTAEALQWVRRSKDQPFFLYLAYTIPHAEVTVPEDSMEPYKGKFPEKPYAGGHYCAQETPNAARAGMISRMDRDVGRLMDLLKKLGLDKDTLVMFSSDNGPTGAGGQNPRFFDSNGPFRGNKRSLNEGGIRVPMIAHWPGRIQAGRVTDHPCAFWDILPTCCELAGLDAPDDIDGLSFAPLLPGRDPDAHEYLYWEYRGKQAVRMGKFKALRVNPEAKTALFDLSVDKDESSNVASQHPDLVARAERLFVQARTPSKHSPLRRD